MTNNNVTKDQQKSLTEEVLTWKSMSVRQKCNFLFSNITVEPMVACYIMPSVLASLATQNLNLEKACRVNLGYSDDVCSALAARNTSVYREEEAQVQQLVAGMQTWKLALQSGLPSLLILFLGAWSDRTGHRKPCMLLPIVGEFLTSVSLLACTYWFYELPMEAAALAEAFWPAVTGGWFTMLMAVFSYVGDITTVESRTLRIGTVNVFLSVGIPIGMSLSGILYMKIGFYGVFAISTVCYVISFVYGLVVVKEVPRPPSAKPENTGEKMSLCRSVADFFAFRHISETFRVAFKEGANNRQRRICVLMIVVMVVVGPMYGEMAVMYLFTRYRFNWNELKFSMFYTYSMVTNLIGTMMSVGIFSHFLKIDDALVGVMSCMSKILASFVYAFAAEDWVIYLAPLVEIINGTSFIAMRSIASKLVPTDELGKVNSLFGVCESLMPLVYGPIYSSVYAATMNTLPGTFFLLGGALTIPAVISFLWLYFESRRDRALMELEMRKEKFAKVEELGDKGIKMIINSDNNKDFHRKIPIANSDKHIEAAVNGIDNPNFLSEHL